MALEIGCQKVDSWKKWIRRAGLSGSTYLCQQGGKVFVTASADHQAICRRVLGPEAGIHAGLDSYIRWDDVSASDVVNILFAIENT